MELVKLRIDWKRVGDMQRIKGGHILHKLEGIIIIGLSMLAHGGGCSPDAE